MAKTTGSLPELKNAKIPADAGFRDPNEARVEIVTPDRFSQYRIKEDDFSVEPKDGYLIAFALLNGKNEPVGIALGKISESNAEDRNGKLTIGSIKYDDSNGKDFSYPTQKLAKKKHLIVDFKYEKNGVDIIFPEESITKIADFIFEMSQKHKKEKAQKSSLEIAPEGMAKYEVTHVETAPVASNIHGKLGQGPGRA